MDVRPLPSLFVDKTATQHESYARQVSLFQRLKELHELPASIFVERDVTGHNNVIASDILTNFVPRFSDKLRTRRPLHLVAGHHLLFIRAVSGNLIGLHCRHVELRRSRTNSELLT